MYVNLWLSTLVSPSKGLLNPTWFQAAVADLPEPPWSGNLVGGGTQFTVSQIFFVKPVVPSPRGSLCHLSACGFIAVWFAAMVG